MIVGFTGTTAGMTGEQAAGLDWLLASLPGITELHQGGCIGADEQDAETAAAAGITVHTHPHDDQDGTAGRMPYASIKHPAASWQERNGVIVANADVLIAAPFGPRPSYTSGVWHAIDTATANNVPVLTLPWPADRDYD